MDLGFQGMVKPKLVEDLCTSCGLCVHSCHSEALEMVNELPRRIWDRCLSCGDCINVCYGDQQALYDITVEIPERKITAIIGPSGCGKSTLLKCFNRLIDLTDGARVSGKIIVDGMNVLDGSVDVTEARRKMGLLPQKPNPLPMSIYDNVAYGPKIHGTHEKNKLSIGQQQRLCLARGLAVEPEILLCDEPTSALDPISSQHIEQQLLKLKEDYTIVLVTHNIHQAMRLSDYVIHRAYINGTFLNDLIDTESDLKGVCDRLIIYMENLQRVKL